LETQVKSICLEIDKDPDRDIGDLGVA